MTLLERPPLIPVAADDPSVAADDRPVTAPAAAHLTAPRRPATTWLVAVGLLAAVVVTLGWAAGWRAHTMTTASMGTDAPVGAVVVSRPVHVAQVQPGDVVVLHPPGRPRTTFTHRVVGTDATGGLHTQGDINGSPDPWSAHQADLIGRVVLTVPALGFALQAVPLALLGTFVLLLVTAGMQPHRRSAVRIAGEGVLGCLLLVHFRPLERVTLISQTIVGGRGSAVVVNTGVLPVRASAAGGGSVVLAPGHVGTVTLGHIAPGGWFRIWTTLHVTGWWWALLAVWALPLVVGACCRVDPAGGQLPAKSERQPSPATAAATAAGVMA